jgi:hypothetical protein
MLGGGAPERVSGPKGLRGDVVVEVYGEAWDESLVRTAGIDGFGQVRARE